MTRKTGNDRRGMGTHVHCIRGVGDGLTELRLLVWVITAKMAMNKNDEPMDRIKTKCVTGARCRSHVTAHLQV